jgi:hypothetical protein
MLILIGNKIDAQEDRAVAIEEATESGNEHGLLYFETSSPMTEPLGLICPA